MSRPRRLAFAICATGASFAVLAAASTTPTGDASTHDAAAPPSNRLWYRVRLLVEERFEGRVQQTHTVKSRHFEIESRSAVILKVVCTNRAGARLADERCERAFPNGPPRGAVNDLAFQAGARGQWEHFRSTFETAAYDGTDLRGKKYRCPAQSDTVRLSRPALYAQGALGSSSLLREGLEGVSLERASVAGELRFRESGVVCTYDDGTIYTKKEAKDLTLRTRDQPWVGYTVSGADIGRTARKLRPRNLASFGRSFRVEHRARIRSRLGVGTVTLTLRFAVCPRRGLQPGGC